MKKRIKLTKKHIGKTVQMYWCGHWNDVFIIDIEDDTFYGIKNGYAVVYNINLNSKTTIPNNFNSNEIQSK